MRVQPEEILRFLIDSVEDHPNAVARLAADRFHLSRQTVNGYLRRLVADGLLRGTGATKGRSYALCVLAEHDETLAINAALEEHVVWEKHVAPSLAGVRENVLAICHFGTTEMVNNAIDHSGSPFVSVSVHRTAARIKITVLDAGIGVFRKIRESCGLESEHQALVELTKGKMTTDPVRHTGEGIFFTARMFDSFTLISGQLSLLATRTGEDDWLFENKPQESPSTGTWASMKIRPESEHTAQETFLRYASAEDDFGFTKTRVVVNLARSATDSLLVSRSQARRLLTRLDRFKVALLDFAGVDAIGPAFADEIFRVFAASHPDVRLEVVAANADVQLMIRRAQDSSEK